MVTESSEQVVDDYRCDVCHYSTSRSDNYAKHILTAKHKMASTGNIKVGEGGEPCYCCEICKKHYKSRKGLWSHNKKCSPITEANVENTMALSSPTVNNNTTINLQIFLKETSIDSINIKEFLENIKVSLEDIENLSKTGFIIGVTDVIKTK